ncbi:uncharacterized protein DDB_G0287625-like [Mytilus californianus]|uniref:uncharacterized protein DDB_G0287625-like n=1 Tax=Mytilus californianus TaxID=6549 RepID=UPI00224801EC|nr:uncharacterized protein DDB_G0287625-like [Mytilus californianus]
MSQYDTEKFCQPPDPDLICCICQCVLQSPVESPCRHVFCNVCITTWLNNHRNCPTCRRRVKKRQLKPVLPIVQNMINRLLMFCDFKDNGCAETVMLEIYINHVEGCGYRKLKCRFNRCDKMILKKDKDQHENQVCEFREKLCIGRCGLMIPVCVYDTHDCYEELQKFNREKSELVDKLQEKVKELNALTQKLQKEVDRLKQQLARNRWNLPDAWGSSWDPSDSEYNDSMYNYLSGSSYSDDQDSHFSQPDLVLTATSHPTATNTTTTTSSSADNGGFREYVIYPSRRPATPVIQAPWPRYETRSSRYVYDIRSPSPIHNATDANSGTTDQALDLSHHTHQENLPMGEGIFHRLSAGISDTALSSIRNINLEYIPTPINNNQCNTGRSTATESNTNLNVNGDDHDSQNEIHNNDELSHHSDHTVYSLSDTDSDHTPTRWWRSSRSSMSHHSEHQSDIQRSSRSRSQSYDSNRSRSHVSRRSRSLSYDSDRSQFWSHYPSHNRSRSVLSDRSGSYDFYRRSRLYNFSRSRSGSFDSYRSRSRSYEYTRRQHLRRSRASSRSSQSDVHYRTWSRSYSRSRSRSRDRLSRSRSRSIERFSRSRSRSIDRLSRSRSRSIERLSRSRSRSLDHVMSRSHSEESLSSSSTLRSYMSRSGSRSSRSCTPDSYRSETPVDEIHDRYRPESSPAHENGHENLNQLNENEKAGNSRHLNITTDIDSTETDSDAGYNFKRRRSKNSNYSDSGIGTESSNTDLSKNQNSDTRDSNVNNGASSDDRKRKTSVIDCDINTKRMRNQDDNNGEQSDSDTSWVPSANDRQTDDTISDEASSGSSYEVEVPKTVLELIDEVDSEGTDDTWSPN